MYLLFGKFYIYIYLQVLDCVLVHIILLLSLLQYKNTYQNWRLNNKNYLFSEPHELFGSKNVNNSNGIHDKTDKHNKSTIHTAGNSHTISLWHFFLLKKKGDKHQPCFYHTLANSSNTCHCREKRFNQWTLQYLTYRLDKLPYRQQIKECHRCKINFKCMTHLKSKMQVGENGFIHYDITSFDGLWT